MLLTLLAHHSKWEKEERKFWKKDYVHPNLKQALHSIEIVDVRKFTNACQVIEFILWESKLVKIQRQGNFCIFWIHRHDARSANFAKIDVSIFYDKNHLNLSKINIQFLKIYSIFVNLALCLFTKYKSFLGVCSVLFLN